jgi:hypothetical protein
MATPVFDPIQIENAIATNRGGGDQGTKRSWDAHRPTFDLGFHPAPFTDGDHPTATSR